MYIPQINVQLFLDSYFVFQSLLANGPSHPQNKYMKLENEIERSNQRYIEDTQGQQQVNLLPEYLFIFKM